MGTPLETRLGETTFLSSAISLGETTFLGSSWPNALHLQAPLRAVATFLVYMYLFLFWRLFDTRPGPGKGELPTVPTRDVCQVIYFS